jgi:hypothetical protein
MGVALVNPRYWFTRLGTGAPLANGRVYVYEAGTTTPTDTWANEALSSANTNPIQLDSDGSCVIWVDPAKTYKFVVASGVLPPGGSGAELYTVDNIKGSEPANLRQLLAAKATTVQGSGLVGHNGSLTYPAGTVGAALNAVHNVRMFPFSALGDGATDDTAGINTALALGGTVLLPPGTYNATTLDMTVDGTSLVLAAGATLSLQTATVTGINVTGARCSVVGPGRILSPASWDGTNSRRTFATVWVASTASDFYLKDVSLINIPRCGINFEDAINGRVEGCLFRGNFPYADYAGVNTGQAAIGYNPPTTLGTTTPTGNSCLLVVGNRVETCVQGVLLGNYDSTASEVGITVTGNSFNQCWDHGCYMILGRGHTIVGNNFTNCKNPIVTDGNSATVTGNSLYGTELTQTNGQQVISVRDATDSVIANNTLFGLGAAILVDCVSGTNLARNRISGNTIRRMGAGSAANAIRLGLDAETCTDNVIEGNTISGGNFGSAGAIQVEMKATFQGSRNVVRGNKVVYQEAMTGFGVICYALYQNFLTVEDNDFVGESTAAAAQILYMCWPFECNYPIVQRNRFYFTTGGANISIRGIQTTAAFGGAKVVDNTFQLSSGSLTAVDALGFVVASGATVSNNQIAGTTSMHGTITWLSGNASSVTANANALATFSRVQLTPTNNGAAALIATPGVKAVITDGNITLSTSDGTNTPGDCTFTYELH